MTADADPAEVRAAHYAPGCWAWVMLHVDDPAHVAHFETLFGQPRAA